MLHQLPTPPDALSEFMARHRRARRRFWMGAASFAGTVVSALILFGCRVGIEFHPGPMVKFAVGFKNWTPRNAQLTEAAPPVAGTGTSD